MKKAWALIAILTVFCWGQCWAQEDLSMAIAANREPKGEAVEVVPGFTIKYANYYEQVSATVKSTTEKCEAFVTITLPLWNIPEREKVYGYSAGYSIKCFIDWDNNNSFLEAYDLVMSGSQLVSSDKIDIVLNLNVKKLGVSVITKKIALVIAYGEPVKNTGEHLYGSAYVFNEALTPLDQNPVEIVNNLKKEFNVYTVSFLDKPFIRRMNRKFENLVNGNGMVAARRFEQYVKLFMMNCRRLERMVQSRDAEELIDINFRLHMVRWLEEAGRKMGELPIISNITTDYHAGRRSKRIKVGFAKEMNIMVLGQGGVEVRCDEFPAWAKVRLGRCECYGFGSAMILSDRSEDSSHYGRIFFQ